MVCDPTQFPLPTDAMIVSMLWVGDNATVSYIICAGSDDATAYAPGLITFALCAGDSATVTAVICSSDNAAPAFGVFEPAMAAMGYEIASTLAPTYGVLVSDPGNFLAKPESASTVTQESLNEASPTESEVLLDFYSTDQEVSDRGEMESILSILTQLMDGSVEAVEPAETKSEDYQALRFGTMERISAALESRWAASSDEMEDDSSAFVEMDSID